MFDPLAYWYLFPIGVAISLVYSSTGISGANFWGLVYIVGLGLEPRVGFWLALVSMLFGSIGGIAAHGYRGTLRPRAAARHAAWAVPAAAAGALAAEHLPSAWLLAGFGLFLAGYGAFLLVTRPTPRPVAPGSTETTAASAGGFLTGLLSVGTGELLLPRLLGHPEMRPAEAAGATVPVVFAASLVAALLRLSGDSVAAFAEEGGQLLSILLWEVPAVLLGSQIGPVVAHRLHPRAMRRYCAAILTLVGALLIVRAV